jgi:hypothetical protein
MRKWKQIYFKEVMLLPLRGKIEPGTWVSRTHLSKQETTKRIPL